MIECRDLSYRYGRLQAISDITIKAVPGQVLGLLGPNGSGKSTLCLCLAGLLDKRGLCGDVLVEEITVASYTVRELAKQAAFVFQDNHFPFDFTVQENVLMGRSPYLEGLQPESERDMELARQAMARCDCLHLADRPVSSLSGGERQRVLLARALAQDTPNLIMDEPTNHLDLRHQKQILTGIREECRQMGKTVILVLHDLNLAGQYCDSLLLLQQGRLAATGGPDRVLTEELLGQVYQTELKVSRHPSNGRPQIFL
jgi:iron complex transport system ATP-binding protein